MFKQIHKDSLYYGFPVTLLEHKVLTAQTIFRLSVHLGH